MVARGMNRDDFIVGLLVAIILMIVASAALGALDMDDTQQRQPLPPPVHQHPQEEP